MALRSGFISVEGGRVWYQIVGEGAKPPLVVIHGGPGYPHDYLEPLADLAFDRPVIFYDQLGCGNSDSLDDLGLCSVTRFSQELLRVITELKLGKHHVIGHSWGAVLAYEHALQAPSELTSVIFADPYLSTELWEADARRLLAQLPIDYQQALLLSNASETYSKAWDEYYRKFVYGMDILPDPCRRSNEKMNPQVYNYMWGPTELFVTGILKDYDARKRIAEIKLPTLFICGRFDEATPESSQLLANMMPSAAIKILEKSAHHSHWTEREEYIATLREFLAKND
jgi:proline iminopeptidase